jgi:outer membrane protein insertion porin family
MKIYRLLILFLLFSKILLSQQYELKSIDFEGNKEFSTSTLKSIILSEESPGWFYKFLNSFTPLGAPPVYFDSSNIPIDMNSILSFYNTNGFFETKVSYKYDVDTSADVINLTYTIHENSPSNYNDLKLFGLEKVPGFIITNMIKAYSIDTTNRYNQDYVQLKTGDALNILLDIGFVYATFDSIVVYKDTTNSNADLNIYFTPGIQYVVDSIVIKKDGEGASEVKNDLLRDVTGILPGQIYNLDELRRSQVRLYRTGLFNSITVSIPNSDSANSKGSLPLLLNGNIGLMNELSPEIIMNNQQGVFNMGLGATYIRKNFLGNARKLTVSSSFGLQDIVNVDFGTLFKKFSFRDTTLLGYFDSRVVLEQPFRYTDPIYATLENYVTIEKQLNINDTRYGSKLSLEFELPHYTFINFLKTSFNIEQSNEVYRTFNDSLSKKLTTVIGAEFGSTTVDDILFPTRGYTLSFQVEEDNALHYLTSKLFNSNFDGALFYKILITNTVFGSFGRIRNYIFAWKLKAGYLQAYIGDYGGIPFNRTFYAGGSNSIRAWRSNQLVPRGTPDVPGFLSSEVNVKGGTFLLEGTLEFRLRFLKTFGVALFTDYGNTWLGYKSFRFDDVAVAAGTGLRYYSSFAPFRLDFAFKFYNPADKEYIFKKNFWKNFEFQFGIGEAF